MWNRTRTKKTRKNTKKIALGKTATTKVNGSVEIWRISDKFVIVKLSHNNEFVLLRYLIFWYPKHLNIICSVLFTFYSIV